MISGYLRSLFDKDLIPTGCKTALLVGTLLFLINHGSACWRQEMNRERWISVALSYLMPYLVSVYGQYSYRRKMQFNGDGPDDCSDSCSSDFGDQPQKQVIVFPD